MKTGFDNDKYLKLQSEKILERIKEFDNKLYLEFGGKIFDDFHAARVLPGFKASSKIELLCKLKDDLEIIICINADAIEKNKIRADIGITYDMEVMRLIDNISNLGIKINSVVITRYNNQVGADLFKSKLEDRKVKVYIHRFTKGYPTDVDTIVSDEGYGANPYIKTTKPLVVVTAPGPGGGKLATCLSQMYHEYKKGIKVGYAKFETFPVWNLPLKHPINIAYEASTADLKDINMIDPWHLDAYGETTVNYNRDVEVFPVLRNILKKIIGNEVYKSPTDMGVNTVGFCITDDEICKKASREEIVRRSYKAYYDFKQGREEESTYNRIKVLMDELNISSDERIVISKSHEKSEKENGIPVIAIRMPDEKIITGKASNLMTAGAAVILNALKYTAKVPDKILLLSPTVIEPTLSLKRELFGNNVLLNIEDVLIALSISVPDNSIVEKVIKTLPLLKGLDAHSTHIMSRKDEVMLRSLEISFTNDYVFYDTTLYYNN